MDSQKRVGRPRVENPVVAKRENVSLDPIIAEQLRAYQEHMSKSLGFKPTLSQTLAHLIARAVDDDGTPLVP